jgi:hypothetical protein
MMMRLLYLLLTITLLSPQLAHAADFSIEANEFAAVLLKHTISNLEISNRFVDVINKASQQVSDPLYQNLWGVIYGALVISTINNEITSIVLDKISENQTLSVRVGLAFSYLGSNSSDVFGPMNGSRGIAMIMKNETEVLKNDSYKYWGNESLLEAYSRVVSEAIYKNTVFTTKLFKEFNKAWR